MTLDVPNVSIGLIPLSDGSVYDANAAAVQTKNILAKRMPLWI